MNVNIRVLSVFSPITIMLVEIQTVTYFRATQTTGRIHLDGHRNVFGNTIAVKYILSRTNKQNNIFQVPKV